VLVEVGSFVVVVPLTVRDELGDFLWLGVKAGCNVAELGTQGSEWVPPNGAPGLASKLANKAPPLE
jgi:hypothetical protein